MIKNLINYCPCGNPAIRLPDGRWKKQDGAFICERCAKIQHKYFTKWGSDEAILQRRTESIKTLTTA